MFGVASEAGNDCAQIRRSGNFLGRAEVVPEAGLEPAQPQWPGDFKSPVSTNFTTRAEAAQNTMKSERVNTFVASLSDLTHPNTATCTQKAIELA